MSPLPANYLSHEDESWYEVVNELWDRIDDLEAGLDDLEAS